MIVKSMSAYLKKKNNNVKVEFPQLKQHNWVSRNHFPKPNSAILRKLR